MFLYELITGRRPFDRNRPRDEQKLLEWVRPHLSDPKKFRMIIDPQLEGNYSLKAVHKLASVANQCLVRQAKSRPKMSEVLEMINKIVSATDSESPQLPLNSLSPKQSSESSRRERMKRRIVDTITGEKGLLGWRSWKPKLVKTT